MFSTQLEVQTATAVVIMRSTVHNAIYYCSVFSKRFLSLGKIAILTIFIFASNVYGTMNGRADVVQHNSYFVCTCLLRCAADGRRVIRQFRRCKFTDFFVAESSLQEQNVHVQAVLQTAFFVSISSIKAKFHYAILVADRFEASRRPAASWNLAYHRASTS